MSYVMGDIEADGPIPGDYSIVCFGAVIVEPALDRTFYGRLRPISKQWVPEAVRDTFQHLRKTRHTHDPLDDARGNAEALLVMQSDLGLKIRLD
jgi:hypothetical protein